MPFTVPKKLRMMFETIVFSRMMLIVVETIVSNKCTKRSILKILLSKTALPSQHHPVPKSVQYLNNK